MPAILRSLQARIVAVFLGLIVAIQLAAWWVIDEHIERNARKDIHTELQTAERVLERLLKQNDDNLRQATQVLALDYGFRAAIASGDADTVQSALANSAERVQAAVAAYTDADFRLVAATDPRGARFVQAIERYARRNVEGQADSSLFEVIDGQPYQIVAVPVRAPAVIGWVGMAFAVGNTLLQDVKSLSGLDAALMHKQAGAPWHTLMSTRQAAELRELGAAWQPEAADFDVQRQDRHRTVRLGDAEFDTRAMPLPGVEGAAPVSALLMRSVTEALAPYAQLQQVLLALSLIGVAVFAVGSVITARHITTPLRVLSKSARRLEEGHYDDAVSLHSRDEIGELARSFETMRVALQVRAREVRRLAYEDQLTDLPNREQFRLDLRAAVEVAAATGAPCAVLMLDLDRFKHVNDVLGHRFGDRLLRAVAERLRHSVLYGRPAVLARLGGDEFAILLPDHGATEAEAVAAAILADFEQPMTLDDHTVDLGAGIGIVVCPEHGRQADELLARAEVAMYAAKQRQAGIVVYQAGLDSGSQESLTLLGELRHAVDHGQLRLFLQPKLDLRTGRVVGAEALIRWLHPERGMVPPMRFIPFAEQTGFIRVLSMWVLEAVADAAQALAARGHTLKIAVNLSTRDLMDQELPAKIESLLARHAIDPAGLVLEITESAIMDDPQRALHTLDRLHQMGLKLSIDDFGTGYSSLAYLKRLPVDELKIDRSFVMNMESDVQDAKIVRSTIDLAHNLGLTVVAEGIESVKALRILASLACDEAQGYFIARPMPADEFADWLADWTPPDLRLETSLLEPTAVS
jgi:diguanylate cyclase (GGDEF)-like protein|nr:EAL domain-containing protein [uncultured Aquabacterium sp.]